MPAILNGRTKTHAPARPLQTPPNKHSARHAMAVPRLPSPPPPQAVRPNWTSRQPAPRNHWLLARQRLGSRMMTNHALALRKQAKRQGQSSPTISPPTKNPGMTDQTQNSGATKSGSSVYPSPIPIPPVLQENQISSIPQDGPLTLKCAPMSAHGASVSELWLWIPLGVDQKRGKAVGTCGTWPDHSI